MSKDSPVKASTQPLRSFPRTVTRSLKVHEMSEGIGLRIRRFIGNRHVRCLPPFVICEQFRIDETGRPPHPARGAQKITFVLTGKLRVDYSSEDSVELGPGDVTSLMVGRGVIKSIKAIPDDTDTDTSGSSSHGTKPNKATASGMQIYMDVPEPFKRIDHSHLNLCHSDIVSCEPAEGCIVKILTGSAFGMKAEQMLTATPALILDCDLKPGATIDIPVKVDWNAFAYVIEGKAWIQGEKTQKSQYVEFMRSSKATTGYSHEHSTDASESEESQTEEEAYVTISVDASASHHAHVLLCAAKPLCQPIYRQGPFVDVSMNWIYQAFDDYTAHKNGFESTSWKGRSLVPSSLRNSSNDTATVDYTKPTNVKPSDSQTADPNKTPDPESEEGEHTYKPCETNECEDENPQERKATNPNVFPPGAANPASYSTVFNGHEGVEEQQEQMLPRRPSPPPKRDGHPGTEDGSASEAITSPPSKRRAIQ